MYEFCEYIIKCIILCIEKIYFYRDVMFLVGKKKLFNIKNIICFFIYGMEVFSFYFFFLNKRIFFFQVVICSVSYRFIFLENSYYVICYVEYILKYCEDNLNLFFKDKDNLDF